MPEPSAHVDTFARDHLPASDLWPWMTTGACRSWHITAAELRPCELLESPNVHGRWWRRTVFV
jgi:hypothetical protein